MNWETIVTILGALGGLEAVKWFFTRKSVSRMASAKAQNEETAAAGAREKLYEDTILFLQQQLKEKEERFADQTERLRRSTTAELRLTRKVGELETRLAVVRCDRIACSRRIPPFSNTVPAGNPETDEGQNNKKEEG